MDNVNEKLKSILEEIMSDYADGTSKDIDKMRFDFVFHMTDWQNDLENILKLYKNPESYSFEEAKKIVYGFLYHATNHIFAASKMLGNVLVNFESESKDKT